MSTITVVTSKPWKYLSLSVEGDGVRVLLLLCTALVVWSALMPEHTLRDADSTTFWEFPLNVTLQSDDPKLIWAAIDSWNNCRELDYPDIPMNAYKLPSGVVQMVSGSTNFHSMQGSSLFNMTRQCGATWNATRSADPGRYTDQEWPTSSFLLKNGTVLAMVHNEYHGKEHGKCREGMDYPYCMQFATGLLVSHNGGRSWDYARPPPHHVIAAVPYPYSATDLVNGWGDPTNIVEKDGHYYVALWNRNARGLQAPGICMMRSDNLLDWKGWNGTHYSVEVSSPYVVKGINPADHICTVLPYHPTLDPNQCNPGGLVYHKSSSFYLMTWTCQRDTFYMTASRDLQNWSHPEPFFVRTRDLNQPTLAHVLGVHYPNLLDPHTDDPNYSTVGDSPYLFFVGTGHSPYSDGRRALALPLKLEVKYKANMNAKPRSVDVMES